MKCWIVCRPCDDPYYGPEPAEGEYNKVFTDHARAVAYIAEKNGPENEEDPYWHDWALCLVEAELQS